MYTEKYLKDCERRIEFYRKFGTREQVRDLLIRIIAIKKELSCHKKDN